MTFEEAAADIERRRPLMQATAAELTLLKALKTYPERPVLCDRCADLCEKTAFALRSDAEALRLMWTNYLLSEQGEDLVTLLEHQVCMLEDEREGVKR